MSRRGRRQRGHGPPEADGVTLYTEERREEIERECCKPTEFAWLLECESGRVNPLYWQDFSETTRNPLEARRFPTKESALTFLKERRVNPEWLAVEHGFEQDAADPARIAAYVDAKVREVLEEFGRAACKAQCPTCATGMNAYQGEEGQWWHARNGCTSLCAADPIRRLLDEWGVK